MSQLLFALFRRPAPLTYTGALTLLGSLALPWLRSDAQGSLGALQAARLFLGPAAWLLFALAIAALLYLLRPLHAMRRTTDALAALALPAWLTLVAFLLLDTQHQSLASGALLGGLAALLLSVGAGAALLQALDAAGSPWSRRLVLAVSRGLSMR